MIPTDRLIDFETKFVGVMGFLILITAFLSFYAGGMIKESSILKKYCRAEYTLLKDYEECLEQNFLSLKVNKSLRKNLKALEFLQKEAHE